MLWTLANAMSFVISCLTRHGTPARKPCPYGITSVRKLQLVCRGRKTFARTHLKSDEHRDVDLRLLGSELLRLLERYLIWRQIQHKHNSTTIHPDGSLSEAGLSKARRAGHTANQENSGSVQLAKCRLLPG